MKLKKIPCWLRNGQLFRNFMSDDENNVSNIKDKIRENSKIITMDDFIEVYNKSNYWALDRYPFDIFVYGFLNKDKVIDFLESENSSESNLLKNDILLNISLDKYGGIIKEDFNNKKIQKYFNFDLNTLLKKDDNFYVKKAFDIIKKY